MLLYINVKGKGVSRYDFDNGWSAVVEVMYNEPASLYAVPTRYLADELQQELMTNPRFSRENAIADGNLISPFMGDDNEILTYLCAVSKRTPVIPEELTNAMIKNVINRLS